MNNIPVLNPCKHYGRNERGRSGRIMYQYWLSLALDGDPWLSSQPLEAPKEALALAFAEAEVN
jgi:hypothetical protein